METVSKKQKRRRDNIEPVILRGEYDFFLAFGADQHRAAKWRSMNMPFRIDGKCFLYPVEEVKEWIMEHEAFKVQVPQLPEPKPVKTAKQ